MLKLWALFPLVLSGTVGGQDEPVPLETRTWKVPADVLELLAKAERGGKPEVDAFTGEEVPEGERLFLISSGLDVLKGLGLTFPVGANGFFDPGKGELKVINTASNLDLLERKIAALGPMRMFVLDERLFKNPEPTEDKLAREMARKRVKAKLRQIIIPEVNFDEATLLEAIEFLNRRTAELDTDEPDEEKRGIRFELKVLGKVPAVERDPELDPTGTLPFGDPRGWRVPEIELKNVPAATVLQYMCGKTRLRYKVEPDRVVLLALALGAGGGLELTERAWHVDPAVMERLRKWLESHDAGEELRGGRDEKSWEELLRLAGLEMPTGSKLEYSPKEKRLVLESTRDDWFWLDGMLLAIAIEISREQALGRQE